MRKRIIEQDTRNNLSEKENWLDLEQMAEVEVTSEDTAHPIEEALALSGQTGWRASKAGMQTIRIIFDMPQRINHILLLFEEKQTARTQEFVLRWAPSTEQGEQEIVRQQYNFSPDASTREEENYTLNLVGVKVLELLIVPDISGGNAHASISKLRMA